MIVSAVFRYFWGLSHQGWSSRRTRAFSKSLSMPPGTNVDEPFSSLDIALLTPFDPANVQTAIPGREKPTSYRFLQPSKRASYSGDMSASISLFPAF
jgi:hypothetical protein